jgi:DNA ligase-1
MQAFAELIDGLIYTRSRDHKVRLIAEYLRDTPDPDRGWALAALAGTWKVIGSGRNTACPLLSARWGRGLWARAADCHSRGNGFSPNPRKERTGS